VITLSLPIYLPVRCLQNNEYYYLISLSQ
jgi:hypothetical protein